MGRGWGWKQYLAKEKKNFKGWYFEFVFLTLLNIRYVLGIEFGPEGKEIKRQSIFWAW